MTPHNHDAPARVEAEEVQEHVRFNDLAEDVQADLLEEARRLQEEFLTWDALGMGVNDLLGRLGLDLRVEGWSGPVHARNGRSVALEGRVTLLGLLHMPGLPGIKTLDPDSVAEIAPLVFELSLRPDLNYCITLTSEGYDTRHVFDDPSDLAAYIGESHLLNYLLDTHPRAETLIEYLREELEEECKHLEPLLDQYLNDLNSTLWEEVNEDQEAFLSKAYLKDSPFLRESVFTRDGEWLGDLDDVD